MHLQLGVHSRTAPPCLLIHTCTLPMFHHITTSSHIPSFRSVTGIRISLVWIDMF